jgi:hypothetical protein
VASYPVHAAIARAITTICTDLSFMATEKVMRNDLASSKRRFALGWRICLAGDQSTSTGSAMARSVGAPIRSGWVERMKRAVPARRCG